MNRVLSELPNSFFTFEVPSKLYRFGFLLRLGLFVHKSEGTLMGKKDSTELYNVKTIGSFPFRFILWYELNNSLIHSEHDSKVSKLYVNKQNRSIRRNTLDDKVKHIG